MRSGSKPSKTSRKRARLCRIVRQESPAWKPSSMSFANRSWSSRSGTPHSPSGESSIPGLEVSGTRDDTGERVCALLAGGGHAEYVAAPTGQVFPAPAGLDLVPAAGIPEAFLTAFANLVMEAGIAPGATVLI